MSNVQWVLLLPGSVVKHITRSEKSSLEGQRQMGVESNTHIYLQLLSIVRTGVLAQMPVLQQIRVKLT